MPARRSAAGDGDFARHPQEPGNGQRRNDHRDQLDRHFKPDQFGQRNDQQIDPEIADQMPFEAEITLQVWRLRKIELDPVAAHMTEQIDQWRHRRVKQRHEREADQHGSEDARFPPRLHGRLEIGSGIGGRHCHRVPATGSDSAVPS